MEVGQKRHVLHRHGWQIKSQTARPRNQEQELMRKYIEPMVPIQAYVPRRLMRVFKRRYRTHGAITELIIAALEAATEEDEQTYESAMHAANELLPDGFQEASKLYHEVYGESLTDVQRAAALLLPTGDQDE